MVREGRVSTAREDGTAAGGAQDGKAAARTSDLVSIAFQELRAQPDDPQFIVGDLNATVADLPSLNMALEATDDDSHHA